MGELEPTRENDARIAEAMGTPWMKPHHGNCCTCQTCGWPHDECKCGWIDDEALVVPMMKRLGELQAGPIDLSPPGAGRQPTYWRLNIWQRIRVFGGTTANLAVGAALLAVWNEVRP